MRTGIRFPVNITPGLRFFGVITTCLICFTAAIPLQGNDGVLEESKLRKLRSLMSSEVLEDIFGTTNSTTKSSYELIYVRKTYEKEDSLDSDETSSESKDRMNGIPMIYSFSALGKKFSLRAERNPNLVGSGLELEFDVDGLETKIPITSEMVNCHFLATNGNVQAAISDCSNSGIYANLIDNGSVYEIRPMGSILSHLNKGDDQNELVDNIHIIRKIDPTQMAISKGISLPEIATKEPKRFRRAATDEAHKTIELAIFVDYNTTFASYLPYIGKDMRDGPNSMNFINVILALVNGVQALYHHSSLGQRVDLSLVKLEVTKQFSQAKETEQLLSDFAVLQASRSKEKYSRHWDLAVYLFDNTLLDTNTIALSYPGHICHDYMNCLVAKFGALKTSKNWGERWSGFGAVLTLAHEIGHTLSLTDDGESNGCPRDGFIMSPTYKEDYGPMLWSVCSKRELAALSGDSCLKDFAKNPANLLRHMQYEDKPGEWWSADQQCDVFFRDRKAYPKYEYVPEVCSNLVCILDGVSKNAGAALPGTTCGEDMWCDGGECVPRDDVSPTTEEEHEGPDRWEW